MMQHKDPNNSQHKGQDMDIKLDELSPEPRTQMRVALDEETIKRYAKTYKHRPQDMPPPDVGRLTDQNGRLILISGHHRTEAARRIGFYSLRMLVHDVSLHEAILLAAASNVGHGKTETAADTRLAVQRTYEATKDQWDRVRQGDERMRKKGERLYAETLAHTIHRAEWTILEIVYGLEVKQAVRDAHIPLPDMDDVIFETIGRARNPKHWIPLVKAASADPDNIWKRDETRLAVNNLYHPKAKDDNSPIAQHNRAVLNGTATPMVFDIQGQPVGFLPSTLRREAKANKVRDAAMAYYHIFKLIGQMQMKWSVTEIARQIDSGDRNRCSRQTRQAALYLTEIAAALETTSDGMLGIVRQEESPQPLPSH